MNRTLIDTLQIKPGSLTEAKVSQLPPHVLRVMEGKMAQADTPNKNKRIYPRKLWERVVEQNKGRKIGGELDHPAERNGISCQYLSHYHEITGINEDGEVSARFYILDTAKGRDLNAIVGSEMEDIGVSTRGTGSTKTIKQNESEYQEVDIDLYGYTTTDFVHGPSVGDAQPKTVSEATGEVEPPSDELLESLVDQGVYLGEEYHSKAKSDPVEEGSEYQKFFKSKLKDYGVKSPAELSDADKKKFFNEIEKEWKKEEKTFLRLADILEKADHGDLPDDSSRDNTALEAAREIIADFEGMIESQQKEIDRLLDHNISLQEDNSVLSFASRHKLSPNQAENVVSMFDGSIDEAADYIKTHLQDTRIDEEDGPRKVPSTKREISRKQKMKSVLESSSRR